MEQKINAVCVWQEWSNATFGLLLIKIQTKPFSGHVISIGQKNIQPLNQRQTVF